MSHAPFLVAVQAGCGSGFNAISALAPGLVSDFHLTIQVTKPLPPPAPKATPGHNPRSSAARLDYTDALIASLHFRWAYR